MFTYSKYSNTAETLPDSPIRDMMVRAAAIPDCISFSVGDPNFDAPDCVTEGILASLNRKETHYAPNSGLDELRDVYADYISGMVGQKYERKNVAVTTGGMASFFLAMLSLLDPGDEVLIAAPYFTNYAQAVMLCHAVPRPVEVYEKDEFQLTAESVLAAITPKTKVLVVNSPCNPTGGLLSRETLEKIAAIAVEHDLFVISDEVYRHIVFDGAEFCSIASLPGMKERTYIVDSVSKTFALTGLRVGFGAGPEKMIKLITKLTEGVYSATGTPNQYGAIEAFRRGMDHCRYMAGEYEKRRNYFYEHLNACKGISCIKPKGAFYLFANISGIGLGATEFCNRLLDAKHVAVVPGEAFGSDEGRNYVRISFAASMDDIVEGCRRIQDFCENL